MVEKTLTGRVAIVTGGGGGMGRAITLALVERGARVAVFDVRKESVDAVVKEASAIGDAECALAVTRDVTKADDCAAAVRETIDAFNSAYDLSHTFTLRSSKFFTFLLPTRSTILHSV